MEEDEAFEVTVSGSTIAGNCVPWTAVFVQKDEAVEVAIFGSLTTCPFVPRFPLVVQGDEAGKVTCFGSEGTFNSVALGNTMMNEGCDRS